MAHTNGIESFWSVHRRGYQGTFHHLSERHAGRHNTREADTVDRMASVATEMVGKRLRYRELFS